MAARFVRKLAAEIDSPADLWRLSLRLTEMRALVAEMRDRRRSVLPLVFARPIREGWIGREDPAGLYDGIGSGEFAEFGIES